MFQAELQSAAAMWRRMRKREGVFGDSACAVKQFGMRARLTAHILQWAGVVLPMHRPGISMTMGFSEVGPSWCYLIRHVVVQCLVCQPTILRGESKG